LDWKPSQQRHAEKSEGVADLEDGWYEEGKQKPGVTQQTHVSWRDAQFLRAGGTLEIRFVPQQSGAQPKFTLGTQKAIHVYRQPKLSETFHHAGMSSIGQPRPLGRIVA